MKIKEMIEQLKKMDEKERKKRIFYVVGWVFLIVLVLNFIFMLFK